METLIVSGRESGMDLGVRRLGACPRKPSALRTRKIDGKGIDGVQCSLVVAKLKATGTSCFTSPDAETHGKKREDRLGRGGG